MDDDSQQFIPTMVKHQLAGLYGAALVSTDQLIILWSTLRGRPQAARGRRSEGSAPAGIDLKFDTLYALEAAPLEPLMLVVLLQQSTAKTVSVVEPSAIPELLATLWNTGAPQTPYPTPLPQPLPSPLWLLLKPSPLPMHPILFLNPPYT